MGQSADKANQLDVRCPLVQRVVFENLLSFSPRALENLHLTLLNQSSSLCFDVQMYNEEEKLLLYMSKMPVSHISDFLRRSVNFASYRALFLTKTRELDNSIGLLFA